RACVRLRECGTGRPSRRSGGVILPTALGACPSSRHPLPAAVSRPLLADAFVPIAVMLCSPSRYGAAKSVVSDFPSHSAKTQVGPRRMPAALPCRCSRGREDVRLPLPYAIATTLRSLRGFDLQESLVRVGLGLDLACGFAVAEQFAFELAFARGSWGEFVFTRDRADRQPVVQKLRVVFPEERWSGYTFAVDVEFNESGSRRRFVCDPAFESRF